MASPAPILLTPGPLTTSERTRSAMMTDWGSWDGSFNALTASLSDKLVAVANGSGSHVCVPLQGSGTFAVEAAVGTFVPRTGKMLVLVNGAYGKRLAKICEMLGRDFSTYETPEDVPTTPEAVDRLLSEDRAVTHVGLIHCETSTGILNPLPEIAAVVARHGRRLIVDAMSSFGALPIDARTVPFEALIAASASAWRACRGWASYWRGRRLCWLPRATRHPSPSICATSISTCSAPASGVSPRRPTSWRPCTKP